MYVFTLVTFNFKIPRWTTAVVDVVIGWWRHDPVELAAAAMKRNH